MQVALFSSCKFNRHFPLLHDCERLHSGIRRPLGARDKGQNSRGDPMVVSLRFTRNEQMQSSNDSSGFFSWKATVDSCNWKFWVFLPAQILGEGHGLFLFVRQFVHSCAMLWKVHVNAGAVTLIELLSCLKCCIRSIRSALSRTLISQFSSWIHDERMHKIPKAESQLKQMLNSCTFLGVLPQAYHSAAYPRKPNHIQEKATP